MKKIFVELILILVIVVIAYSVGRNSATPTANAGIETTSVVVTSSAPAKSPNPVTETGTATVVGSNSPTGTSKDACISASSKWALWTNGTCLRGANIWQLINDPSFNNTVGNSSVVPPFKQADFDALAAMGANVVNISGPGLYSDKPPYALDTAVQANLDNLLDMIEKANMFAVIIARSGPGRNEQDIAEDSEGPGGPAPNHLIWNNKHGEQDAYIAMWKYTANRYKNNPIVVGYDLMCEPHPNEQTPEPAYTPQDFYSSPYANTTYDWNLLANKITAAIRQVDADTPILLGGMGWYAPQWMSSLTSTNSKIVYLFHQYEPSEGYTTQPVPHKNSYGTTSGTYTRKDLLDIFNIVSSFRASKGGVPVVNDEFGIERWNPGADQFLNDEMEIMENSGMNYMIHQWESSYPGANVDSFNFRLGTDPANEVDVAPNVLMTVIQKYFQKNTVRPSNRNF